MSILSNLQAVFIQPRIQKSGGKAVRTDIRARLFRGKPAEAVDLTVHVNALRVGDEGGEVAHERVGRLEEPGAVEMDTAGVQTGLLEDFAPDGILGTLAAVDIAGDEDIARSAVLLDEQDAAGLFVCDDHADRRVVHGKAVFAAGRAEGHDAFALERLFDERCAAFPAVFLYHDECPFGGRMAGYFDRRSHLKSRQMMNTASAVFKTVTKVP